MSKRKRAPKPSPDDSTDDASVKDDMVHVNPDLLSGSPDIFASRKPAGEEDEAAAIPEPPETVSEPIEPEAPAAPEPTEASTTLAPEATPEPGPEPPTAPPPYVDAVPYPPRPRRSGGSSAALGIVLVVVGLFALLVVISGVDLTENGWPLFILRLGLTLLVVVLISFGSAATIPA